MRWVRVTLMAALFEQCSGAGADGPTASAPDGTFNGLLVNGTKRWLGVPYAEPPTGDLRWRKTVPKAKLSSPLDTKKYAADCAQIGPGWPSLGGMIKDCHNFMQGCPNMTWSRATSEDCLYLNVYAPESSTDSSPKLPVIVYFPSGAFQWGASNDWENNAYKKAENMGWKNVVLVTSAYRTGIFGFLASPGLSARSGDNSSGLFGIHDQTMVLKWIQRNIGAFGGDSSRVMIFGESAGATSMSLHLVMPESAGLFHAVAIDSGAFNQWTYRSWSDAQDDYNTISKAIGCDQTGNETACFLSKPTWALLNVSDAYYGNATGKNLPHPEAINNTQWGPVVEGNLLPQPPIQMLREGKVYGGPQVPVLLGSNADEGSTFLTDQVSSKEDFKDWCNIKFGNTTGALVSARYIKLQPPIDPDYPRGDYNYWNDAAQNVIGDFAMRCPTRNAALWLSEQGHDVFLYDFAHQPGESVNWPTGTQNLGAFHGAEVPFVFNDGFELMGGEHNLSNSMSTYWTNMASSGDPNKWTGPTAGPPPSPLVQLGGTQDEQLVPMEIVRRQLQFGPHRPNASAVRSPDATFWWHFPGADCDTGVFEHGHCSNIESCTKLCVEDKHCGGFRFERKKPQGGGKTPGAPTDFKLKYADCSQNLGGGGGQDSVLYFLREIPMPPPPPPQWNLPQGNCSLFQQRQDCFHAEDGFKKIAINISIVPTPWGRGSVVNSTCLGQCCEHCLADARCKHWFVPPPKNTNASNPGIPLGETVCVLMDGNRDHKHINNSFCIGASAPAWVPPPQCHSRFTPFGLNERVNWTASSMPPPPPPAPPGMTGCATGYDVHHSRFLNGTVYDSIALPPNGDPDTLLSKCCAKCTADGKKCDGWQFGELCDDPDPGPSYCDPKHHEMCPGTGGKPTQCPQCGRDRCKCPSSSKCKPPTHCKLITNGKLLDQPINGTQTASVSKDGGGPGPLPPPSPPRASRKILHDKTLGECCEACYYDVPDNSNFCNTWEMPGYPSNKTCILYTGFGIQMSYHSDTNYTGRGAKRSQNQHKPPPPPPGPCATKQSVMPVKWPKYEQSTKANIRFDLCNITTENDLKEDSCIFWDRVFPINASYPPGQDYHTVTQVVKHRLRTANELLEPWPSPTQASKSPSVGER